MSLLDRHFDMQAARGLAVYPVPVPGESTLDPGFLYSVEGADQSAIFGLRRGTPNQRVALKIITPAENPPGGPLKIVAAEGQLIEDDLGQLVDGAATVGTQALGAYREWICDPDGNWLMVSRAAGSMGGVPLGQIVIQGVPVVIQGVPLVNTVPAPLAAPPSRPIIARPVLIVPRPALAPTSAPQAALAPVPLAGETIELEDAFADASLEMDASGEKFRVATALQELTESRVLLDFTLRTISVASTDYEEIGVQRFDPTGLESVNLRLVAEMDVAAFGQVAELQLVELNSGTVIATLSTDKTVTTPCAVALVLPSVVTLYSVRLRRVGGNSSLRVACRSVALELTNA